jgi:hypothetical protein
MEQIYLEDKKSCISLEEVKQEMANLIGLPIAEWYRGGGSFLHFQLGNLVLETIKGLRGKVRTQRTGEYTLVISGDWRVKRNEEILITNNDVVNCIENFVSNYTPKTIVNFLIADETLTAQLIFSDNTTLEVKVNKGWIGIHRLGQYAIHRSRQLTEHIFIKTPIILTP